MRRMQSDIQHRTTQFQHEVKKLEQESTGLKKRLNTLLQTPAVRPSKQPLTATTSSSFLQRCRSSSRSLAKRDGIMSLSAMSIDTTSEASLADAALKSQVSMSWYWGFEFYS